MSIWIVTGSRRIEHGISLALTLAVQQWDIPSVLHVGDAPGVDAQARKWAKLHGINLIEHKADWNKYGNGAGPIRNQEMVNAAARESGNTICLAYPDKHSRGTWDCIRKAADAGIPVFIVPL